MKELVIHKTVHGERYTFRSGHKVIGVNSTDFVQAHKYSSGKVTTSLNKTMGGYRTRSIRPSKPKKKHSSIEDARLKLESSMMNSEDTGTQALATGIKGTKTGSKVLWESHKLGRTVVPKTGKMILGAGKRVYTAGRKTLNVSRGLVSGKVVLDKSTVEKIKAYSTQKVKKGISKSGATVKELPVKAIKTIKDGVVNATKTTINNGISSGRRKGSDTLSNSGDTGSQSVVAGKDFVKYGYRTLKTVRNIYTYPTRAAQGQTKVALAYARVRYTGGAGEATKGLSKLSKKLNKKSKANNSTSLEGSNVSENINDWVLNIARRIVFNPVTIAILITVILMLPHSLISVGATAAIIPGGVVEKVSEVADGLKGIYEKVKDTVSGVADWILGNNPDVDMSDLSVEEYLLGASDLYREDVVNRINETQQDYLDTDYHVIKIKNLYGAEARAELSAVDRDFIANSLISTEDIVDIIMPLFNSIMLGTYGGSATASEINNLTEELNNVITDFEVLEASQEQCGGSADICLNPSEELYHNSDSGLACCVSSTDYCDSLDDCENIQVTEIPVYETVDGELVQVGTVEMEFCGGHSQFRCNGYTECLGHNVVVFMIGNKTIDDLMQNYFLDRIDELNSKSNLTEEERRELINLEQYYQFALGLFDIYQE